MRQNLKNQVSLIYIASVLAVVLLAIAATNETVTRTATGAFSNVTGVNSETALKPETNAEETNKVNLQKGLQGYWRFDDPEVSRGYSLQFDGNDDYVDNPVLSLSGEENYTLSVWVKAEDWSSGRQEFISGEESSGTNKPLDWGINPSGELAHWRGDSAGQVLNYSLTGVRGWHHIVFVENQSHLSYFFDGKRVDLKNFDTPYTPTGNFEIGRGSSYGSSGAEWNGHIDSLRAYDRVLTSPEIHNLYNEKPISYKSLVLHQDFDEGSDDCDLTSNTACLTDGSQYSNAGTPQNFNDNKLATGSGWIQETPVNRPTVKDSSANTQLGTVYGGNNGIFKDFNFSHSDSGWISGKKGDYALEFDGENDRVKVRSTQSLPVDNESWSMSFWIYPRQGLNGSGRNGWVLWRGSGPEDTLLSIGAENNEWEIAHWSNDWTSGVGIDFDQWQHIVVTYDSSISNNSADEFVYKNGELSASREAGPLSLLDENLIFGGRGDANENADMILDDVRIYGRPLSPMEVKSLYQGESVTKGLVGRWNFEAGDRKTAYDTSSFDKEGVLGSSSALLEKGERIRLIRESSQNFTLSTWFQPEFSGGGVFKKPIEITENSGNKLTDYQIELTIDTKSLISQGKMQPDCEDLRFYSSENGKLDYWVQRGSGRGSPDTCNTRNTRVFVKLETLPASSSKTIYIYYGNETSSSRSSGEQTFFHFDNFNDENLSSEWTWTGEQDSYNEGSTISDMLYVDHGNNKDTSLYRASMGNTGFAVGLYNEFYDNGDGGKRHGGPGVYQNTSNWIGCAITGSGDSWEQTKVHMDAGNNDESDGGQYYTSSRVYQEIRKVGDTYRCWAKASAGADWDKGASGVTDTAIFSSFHPSIWGDDWARVFDNFYVRKYTEPQPTVTIGEESIVGISDTGAYGITSSNNRIWSSIEGETLSAKSGSQWSNIVQTYNGSRQKLYINGELVGEKVLDLTISNISRHLIAGDALTSIGKIDEVRIYNRSLSGEEVKKLAFQ